MNSMNQELFDAFDDIVVKTMEYRKYLNGFFELIEFKDHDEPGFFMRNFCTSVIDTGRMSGKTTYAANKCVGDWLCIVGTDKQKNYILSLNKFANVVSINEFIDKKLMAANVIVDDYKSVFNVVDEKIVFRVIGSSGCLSVLLLG